MMDGAPLHAETDLVARPRLHLTPDSGWLSDPNGLFVRHGVYHAYFQHHPHDVDWGPMHWGHATSPDLLCWTHEPIALEPDANGMIFSGSGWVDENDELRAGPGTVVAAFTLHHQGHEVQCLARSTDGGWTFTVDTSKPVLRPRTPGT